MHHPFDIGRFWLESHYPIVKIFRQKQTLDITLCLSPDLHQKFQEAQYSHWTYHWNQIEGWIAYPFSFFSSKKKVLIPEIQALNALLNFCYTWGVNENETVTAPAKAQLALIAGENPKEFGMSAYGLWAHFSAPAFRYLKELSRPQPLEEYVGSRMRGVHKIISPAQKISRPENEMRLYRGGNPLPILKTFGNCACFSVTSNELDHAQGFTLSPHNIDSHHQQFLLMVGTLILWQRIRRMVHSAH